VLKSITADKRSWHFVASNVHDFVWAADPDYNHLSAKAPGGTVIHVIYNQKPNNPGNDSLWQNVLDAAVKELPFMEAHFGKYAYPQYSFIHGGDGGMEYPMATLIVGPSLGTVFHEWMHSWYQMMLGTNESEYPWMDEGFASYAEDLVSDHYYGRSDLQEAKDALAKKPDDARLLDQISSLPEHHMGAYASYFALVKSGLEEPLTTHSDHFNSNFAYSISSYSKGDVFMEQLGYIVGAAMRDRILLKYYDTWRFKHPNAWDFVKLAQDESNIQLDWYKEYWVNTTKTIDYAIDSLWEMNGNSMIRLKRIGQMPMPIDLQITMQDGTTQMHYVPLNLMFGAKAAENGTEKRTVHEEWMWTKPLYTVVVPGSLRDMKRVELDPSKRMADVQRKNNVLDLKW
jgi:hypothetical protein